MLEQLATCTKMTYNHALSKSDNLTRIHVSKIKKLREFYTVLFQVSFLCILNSYGFNKVGRLLLGGLVGCNRIFFKSIIIGAI